MARSSALAALLLLLIATPAYGNGQLLLESEPSGAEVVLDGRVLGRTPLLAAEIPDGSHEVVVRRKGYQSGHLTVQVLPDLTTRRQLQLRRLGASGELRVTSEPAGAQVLLDGRPVGRTPLHLRRVAPGDHRVVLRRPGYRDGTRTVRVVADLATVRHVPLGALRAPNVAARPAPKAPAQPPRPRAVRPTERPRQAPVPAIAPKVAAKRLAPPTVVTAPPGAPRRPEVVRPEPVTPRGAMSPVPLVPVRPPAPEPLPWKHMAFYGAMGMFFTLVAGVLWQRREVPAGWQEEKPLARFQPLTPGNGPMAAVECCLRAIRLVQAGEVALGTETMLAAYRQAPTPRMVYNLGLAWHLAGSPLAETAYRTVIRLDPTHREARYNLARLLADAGRPYEALVVYRELVAIAPDDGSAWFNLGTLQARLGLAPDAVAALRRARRLLRDDPACRHNLRLARKLAAWWGRVPRSGFKRLLPASR